MAVDEDLFKPVPFGNEMRKAHFLLAPEYTPLNHGSFGTYPRAVQSRFRECQDLSEARPDAFVRHDVPKMLDSSRETLARYLNVETDEVVLVPNATNATNVILRSMKFERGDVVVHFSTAYGAVEKTVEYLRETTPLENVPVYLSYPMSDDDVLKSLRTGIQDAKTERKNVRAVLLDTISSMPGVHTPWEQLVQVCKDEGVLSVVDGAHGVGQIPIDLGKVQPDFFVSNLHKWLFVPRPAAVFYVPKRNQHLIRSSLPTSHGFCPLPRDKGAKEIFNPLPMEGKSPFVLLFEFVATTDSSAYHCIEQALRFRQEACGGEENIMEYCKSISDEAGAQAASLFGTEVMENAQGTLGQSAFSNVKLPIKMGSASGEIPKADAMKVVNWISKHLIEDYDTYASIYLHAGSFWVRFSGQIYLEPDDFVNGAHAIKSLCEQASAGEYLSKRPRDSPIRLNVS